jgi:protein-disulfide isomerase
MTDAEAPRSGAGPSGLLRLLGGWKGAILAALLGALAGAALMSIFSGRLVRSYLLTHPEVIPEAMDRLQARQSAHIVGTHRAALETPFGSAWAGAEHGDVVLVEFFDYACTYCRKSNPDIERLLREDPNLKLVWREWPVLGPDSEAAAQVSLAAARQGKFRAFHDRMFALGRPSAATIAEAQRAVGIPAQLVERIGSEAQAELGRNHQLAQALEASGTPTFVVGDRILQGAVGYDALKAAIAEARARG